MGSRSFLTAFLVGLIAIVAVLSSLFIIKENEWGVLSSYPSKVFEKGAYFKFPGFDNVVRINRGQRVYNNQTNQLKYYLIWKIENIDLYLHRAGIPPNERLLFSAIQEKIEQILQSLVNKGEGNNLMQILRDPVEDVLKSFGVHLIALQTQLLDIPATPLSEAGKAEVLLTKAQDRVAEIQDKGRRDVAAIYDEWYQKDPEFYLFYQHLKAYRQLLNKEDLTIVVGMDKHDI